MRVSDFDFELPEDRIALEPACPRDAARLLYISDKSFIDRAVRDLPSLLRTGDVLVLNDTKVIPAQLVGMRPPRAKGGAPAREGAQLKSARKGAQTPEGVEIDVTLHKKLASNAHSGAWWKAFVRPAKRLREGDPLDFGAGLSALVEDRTDGEATLRFNLGGADFEAALARAGLPPLPP